MGTNIANSIKKQALQSKTREECIEMIESASKNLKQHRFQLKIDLRLEELSLLYDEWNWSKSKLKVKARKHPEGLRWEDSELSLQQVLQITQTLQQLGGKQLHQKPQPMEKKQTTIHTTPTGLHTHSKSQEDNVLCCICFEKRPKTVLPCSHSYCRECAVKFIAQQKDHRCPQCRMEYEGSPDDIKSSFFQVYEEEQPLYEQARCMVVGYLAETNPQIVHQLQP